LGRVVVFLVIVLAALAVVGAGAWFYGHNVYVQAGPPNEDGAPRTVTIEQGSGVPAIAKKLKASGAIRDEFEFSTAIRTINWWPFGEDVVLKAGEYAVPSGASIEKIIEQLSEGKALHYAVVIPEGLTSEMIMKLLAEKEWKPIGGAGPTVKLAGDRPPTPAEGVMLPGDYAIKRGDTIESVVQRSIKAQKDLMAELWPNRQPGLPFKTPEEAINLASIVENETGVAAERPLVASLFVNRLRRPMRLESDVTIVYGLTRGVPLGHGIRVSERARKTEWNTYQIDGLPKTPICNPGREAIAAVLDPPVTNYYYFVADGTGGHAFASTFGEHQRNVANWRRIEAEAGQAPRSAPRAAAPMPARTQ
jgi:UPF0755 protein